MSRIAVKFPLLCCLAAAICVLASTPVSAAVIASQASVDGGVSFESTITFGLQNGDTFAMSNSGQVTGLEWWGTQTQEDGGGGRDTAGFYLRLFSNLGANAAPVFECDYLGNSPSTCDAPIVADSTTLLDSSGGPVDKFSISLATKITLAAGTYLLSIGYENDYWYWLEGGGNGESHLRAADNEAWQSLPPDLAFSVIGELDQPTVPEPGTLALLGLVGLGGMLSSLHRRVAK